MHTLIENINTYFRKTGPSMIQCLRKQKSEQQLTQETEKPRGWSQPTWAEETSCLAPVCGLAWVPGMHAGSSALLHRLLPWAVLLALSLPCRGPHLDASLLPLCHQHQRDLLWKVRDNPKSCSRCWRDCRFRLAPWMWGTGCREASHPSRLSTAGLMSGGSLECSGPWETPRLHSQDCESQNSERPDLSVMYFLLMAGFSRSPCRFL